MTANKIAGAGRGITFLRAHTDYNRAICLTWPYSRDDKGYGILGNEGRVLKAHRVMCELVHGPAPLGHEASHSCGRGHLGCVNPTHLSWKTRSENQLDRRRHGTQQPRHWGRAGKLTPAQVLQISALKGQKTEMELAKMFDCTPTNINKIHNGQRWAHLTGRSSR